MPNRQVADLIARRLPELVHPGDAQTPAMVLPLPMFRQQALPPEMAEHFAKEAGFPKANVNMLVAEAIVSLIETEGEIELVTRPELAKLRLDATSGMERNRQVKLTCRLCGNPIINKMNVDTNNPTVDGVRFLTALQKMNKSCPHNTLESA
jgi:hypothetical protein